MTLRAWWLCFISLAIGVAACAGHRPPAEADGLITRPLSGEELVTGHFVAYTIFWQVQVPGGDPIVFGNDSSVQNIRAGLQGRWELLDDTTVLIAGRPFYHRIVTGDLVSFPPNDTLRLHPLYWIRRAGSARPLR